MSQATKRMLIQRQLARQDKLHRRFRLLEPRYRLACHGMGPMSVEEWLYFFEELDAYQGSANVVTQSLRSHPKSV